MFSDLPGFSVKKNRKCLKYVVNNYATAITRVRNTRIFLRKFYFGHKTYICKEAS